MEQRPSSLMKLSKCIFCGDLDMVETRIWPEWLDRRFPDAGASQTLLSSAPLLVCKHCSEGWMAARDGEVAGFLGPVLDGEQAVISVGQIKALAGWLCLLAVKLAAGSGTCVIAPADRAHLRHTGQPPQNWGIFVAGLGEAGWSRSCQHHPCRIEFSGNPIAGRARSGLVAACNTQVLSVGIGSLFFQLFSSPSLVKLHDFTAASRSERLTQIWPPTRRFGFLARQDIRLPLALTLTDQEAWRLADGFAGSLKGPEAAGRERPRLDT